MKINLTTRELEFILDGLVMLFDDVGPSEVQQEIMQIHDDLHDVAKSRQPDRPRDLERILKGSVASRIVDGMSNDPLDW